ncbi:UNVERIFIED_CONTAM: hypothetical protein FKN15_027590 [Acipenser sinensis]
MTGDRETGDRVTVDIETRDSVVDLEEVSDPAPIPGSPGPSGEGGPVQGGAVGEREEGSSMQKQEREAQVITALCHNQEAAVRHESP